MLNAEKAQEHYGFSGGWRPQRIDGGAQEPRGRHSVASGAGAPVLGVVGDEHLAQRAAAEHREELLEQGERWREGLPSWDEALYGQQGAAERELPVPEPAPALKRAPLIAVVGGSGGVGRSTVAVLSAALSAAQGMDVALVEGDLQFGDLGFWFGLEDSLPNLGSPRTCTPVECPPGFALYKAPLFPEVAEEVEDVLAQELERMRAGRDLLIADTGGMWSGYTASLLLQCDLYFMVVDQRPSSVASALKACELCHRLKVPRTRMVVVYNRWSSKVAISAREVGRALDATHLCCIQDGREPLDELIRCSGMDELLQGENPALAGARELLRQALPRVGCSFEAADSKRKGLFK